MNEKILTLLKRPSLWQRSIDPFWDDEHISKGMLEAHLEPDWDSASRKHSDIRRSVQWLSTIIPTNGKILDLGCGPGLYTKPLSEMGYDVTGIDYSRRSIAYAKSQDKKTEYIYKNYLEIDYTDLFDAITLINFDYGALIPNERQILLSKVYRALKPRGLFIFDVFSEKYFKDKEESRSWSIRDTSGFWSPEPHVCLAAKYFYEGNTVSVDQHIVITNENIHEYLTWDTAYTVQTLTNELSPFGFGAKEVFDDACGSPYSGEADALCFVAIKHD